MKMTKDIYENVVKEVDGFEGSLHYFATESEITNEDFTCKIYGIRVEKRTDEVVNEIEEILDITSLHDEIIHLLNIMSKNLVTPVSASYIIEDYIV